MVKVVPVNPDLNADLKKLGATSTTIEKMVDVDEPSDRIRESEAQAVDPSLWDDPGHTQQITSVLSQAQTKMKKIDSLRGRLDDLPVIYELTEEESDSDAIGMADAERAELRATVESLEVTTMLLGPYDGCEMVINIRPGASGVDATDWAETPVHMYLHWADKHRHKVEVYDTSYVEKAGIKSAIFIVRNGYMYGTPSIEQGAYRLVRISPFNNQGRRQTPFAEVEVLPIVGEMDHIDTLEPDLHVDVYRSSGPGGQLVNTTGSAVRLTHIPTGIVVTCRNEKSQHQNRAPVMRVLRTKLLEKKRQEEHAESDALGAGDDASRGNQMCPYVLYPYQMVEGLRIECEVNNPQSVLDDDLDGLVEVGIRQRMAQQSEGEQH